MAESYSNAKTGIYNYTVQTVEPTVQRYTVAKTYSMEKINESASFVSYYNLNSSKYSFF